MSEEDKKRVEEIIEENLKNIGEEVNAIIEVDDIKFEDIRERLELEAKNIEYTKNLNISVSLSDRDEAVKEIIDDESLSEEEKKEKVEEIVRYYEAGKRLVGGNQTSIIKEVISKTSSLMNDMYDEITNEANELNLNDHVEKKLKQYNENIDAIAEFSNSTGIIGFEVKKIDLDINRIRDDSKKYNEFHSKLNKENITYENLNEKIDVINDLLDRNPNVKKLIDDAQNLAICGNNILSAKFEELIGKQKKLNLSNEEARIYDQSNSSEEFVEQMLNNDSQAKELNKKISVISNEIQQIKEDMKKVDKNSEEYEKLEKDLDEKLDMSVEFKNSLEDMKDKFLSRKIELDRFSEENGKEIEVCNALSEKIKSLKIRTKEMTHMYNYNKKNRVLEDRVSVEEQKIEDENNISKPEDQITENDLNENNKSEDEIVVENEQDKPETKIDEEKDEKSGDLRKEDKKSKDRANNVGAQTVVAQNPVVNPETKIDEKKDETSKDNQLQEISNTQCSQNLVDDFLKMSVGDRKEFFANEDGYNKLSDAITTLVDNNQNFNIPRKERKKIMDIINSEMKYSLSKNEVNENKDEILELFTKLNNGDIKSSEDLFKELFTYNESSKLPFIAESLIDKKDQYKLAKLLDGYRLMLEDGELNEKEIASFEKFIVNPLLANNIKQDISGMGFFSRMKAIFRNKAKAVSARGINGALKDLIDVRGKINSGKFVSGPISDLSDLVVSNMDENNIKVEEKQNELENCKSEYGKIDNSEPDAR